MKNTWGGEVIGKLFQIKTNLPVENTNPSDKLKISLQM